MRILLTEDSSLLGAELSSTLSDTHQVSALPAGSDLTDADAMWSAVRAVDAVVHTGVSLSVAADGIGYDAERAVLDEATRGMHVLLDAVTQTGIRRFIYCSTLELFSTVPHDRYISEHWQPDPGTDMLTLSRHLAEQVTREFARERAITITILRLGRLRREEDVLADEDPDLMWLDRRDAAVAVERAVDRDQSQQLNWQSRWTVYHICARPPHPKFLLDGAGGLGFEPVYNFAAAWEGGSA
jgi:nucleoside-diphosphate-sugar epimerase